MPTHLPSWSIERQGRVPLVIAHRGASARAPENSLAAFHRAATDGADGVELDVLQCGSGEVVVFHDDDLARLAGRPERVADVTWPALRALRLLSGAAIPTLDEALEATGGSLLVNVELKASAVSAAQIAALVDAVAVILARAGAAVSERVLVSSFHPGAIAEWRRRVPDVRAGLLIEKLPPGRPPAPAPRAWSLHRLRPFSVHPEAVLCTPAAVQRWHRDGYRVTVWTVDDESALHRFADMAVDGVITNDPARARAALLAARTAGGDH